MKMFLMQHDMVVCGGYSVGTLNVSTVLTLYVHVGQFGGTGRTAYGGGGMNKGGGSSDVRTASGAWGDSTGLLSRIIVAGGGGGARANSE